MSPTTVYVDFLSFGGGDPSDRELTRKHLLEEFTKGLESAVDRRLSLSTLILDEPFEDYLPLLLETRTLFTLGLYYSCVAMCGIVGERLLKNLFRSSVRIELKDRIAVPQKSAFDQLERIEMRAITAFLRKTQALSEGAFRAAYQLQEIRNDYAHSRGEDSRGDSLKAMRWLDAIIGEAVSLLRHHPPSDGKSDERIKPNDTV